MTQVPQPLTLRELDAIAVDRIRGVGERKQAALREVGISSVLDLVAYYPADGSTAPTRPG
jgi:hypothetical protein